MRRARAQGREARDRTGEGEEGAKNRKKTKPRRVLDARGKTGETRAVREKKRRQENVGSIDIDRGCLANSNDTEREAQCAQGVYIRSEYRVCPLCRVLSEVFVISITDPLGGPMRVA